MDFGEEINEMFDEMLSKETRERAFEWLFGRSNSSEFYPVREMKKTLRQHFGVDLEKKELMSDKMEVIKLNAIKSAQCTVAAIDFSTPPNPQEIESNQYSLSSIDAFYVKNYYLLNQQGKFFTINKYLLGVGAILPGEEKFKGLYRIEERSFAFGYVKPKSNLFPPRWPYSLYKPIDKYINTIVFGDHRIDDFQVNSDFKLY